MDRDGAREDFMPHYGPGDFILRAAESFQQGSDRIRFAFEKGLSGALEANGKVQG